MSRNSVVLVRQGPLYEPEYVMALTMKLLFPVTTLTDMLDTPGAVAPLNHNLSGWWAKLELFAPENKDLRPFLYIDLDSYVLGPIGHLFGGDRFTMVEDFYCPERANSSVMWVPEDVDHIWDDFAANKAGHMAEAGKGGDQAYLERHAQAKWNSEVSGIKSYKRHARDAPDGCIVQFHGKPRPHEATGWAADVWNRCT